MGLFLLSGNEGIVELLMNNGANPNIKDRSGQTAKDLAISKGNVNTVGIQYVISFPIAL